MSDYTTADIESSELDKRDVRALVEYMTTLEVAPDVYSVTTESGAEYTVDARDGRCSCPDAKHNLPTEDGREMCKHRARVAFAEGERAVPAWVDRDAVDEQLGIHVDGTPQVAATDGGVIDAGDEGVILDEDEGDDGRPGDCECAPCLGELPCWACYREGFDIPNPDVVDE